MAAVVPAGTGKSVGQDAAFQKAPSLAFGMSRYPLFFPFIARQCEERVQVVLHHPLERCVGGATMAVGAATHPCGWTVISVLVSVTGRKSDVIDSMSVRAGRIVVSRRPDRHLRSWRHRG